MDALDALAKKTPSIGGYLTTGFMFGKCICDEQAATADEHEERATLPSALSIRLVKLT